MSRHPAIELLSSYVDEEVTPRQLRLLANHLEDCTDCRKRLEGLRAVASGVRRLESVAPPATLGTAVERRLRLDAHDESRSRGFEDTMRRWLGQPVLAPAFAVVLAMGAIIYLFSLGLAERAGSPTRLVVASAPSEDKSATKSLESAQAEADSPPQKAPSAADVRLEARSRSVAAVTPSAEAFADKTAAPVAVEGRSFVRQGELWVEVGLENETATEMLDLRSASAVAEELASFAELGRVRLRVGDRVVEVIYPTAGQPD